MFPGGIPTMKFDDYKPKHINEFFNYMKKHKDISGAINRCFED
jgi:hypothetical protein